MELPHLSHTLIPPALPVKCPSLPPQISGQFKIDGSGNVELKEEDGIDYAAVTVQLPGGERVPFLFTIKELSAKARRPRGAVVSLLGSASGICSLACHPCHAVAGVACGDGF